jgi:hypothetical protein
MAHKKYPFYVVFKADGRVLAGAEYRGDAEDFRRDLPVATMLTQVLTAKGVERKFGKVEWAKSVG